ncbi:hypothetical protein [Corynebacterium pseudodiphtheriticum]|uniref:hypothetical protein n=1 Tax=Corynebacterium pseudodiphtheriticum TaxID=37637 RepID=UPI002B2D4B81|nr:hypothetical protein HH207_06230 [Corynebacterium pseudodiphtheriticum]UNU77332.1 hypothetical protein HH208_05990 [Corynebacterium pseudodiphtheriticum]
MAENVNGPSQERTDPYSQVGDNVVKVEIATFEWVSWWNETRLHQSLGYRDPVEVENGFWEQDESREIIENRVNA